MNTINDGGPAFGMAGTKHTSAVGEFAIYPEWGENYVCAEILNVTAKKTMVRGYGTYTKHLLAENVRFSGPEAVAKALLEQIMSSTARMREETCSAQERHQKRVSDLIARAESRP